MTRHLSVVVSLCYAMLGLTAGRAVAQTSSQAPAEEAQPTSDAADEEQAGGDEDEQEHKPVSAKISLKSSDAAEKKTGEQSTADKERCAQLMAQGNSALAQAEGCGGGDQPIYAGSIVSFAQTTAPASRTLWNANNPYYALSLYVAPRFVLTKKWSLTADASLGYEVTQANDPSGNYVQSSDARLLLTGNLGTVGGLTFVGGPRLVIPTSKPSWAAQTYGGVGAGLNVVKNFEVLQGLALIVGGAYVRTVAGQLTRQIRDDDAPTCSDVEKGAGGLTSCVAGTTRIVQDSVRAIASTSLNFTAEWNLQASYLYGWNILAPFAKSSNQFPTATGTVDLNKVDSAPLPDTRVRRLGSFSVSISYQPATWFIASLQGSTSVCYDSYSGGQSSFGGGCAGGKGKSEFWLNNPIANKFSNLALQLTIPVDAFIQAVTSGPEEKRTARRKGASRL